MHRRFLISRFFIVCIGFVLSEIQIVAAESFPQVRFTPLPSDILPSNEVRKLYQDSDGYIWIPTYNGLARYDGYGAITYGMRDVSNGLFNTFVNVVAEDHDKNLWIDYGAGEGGTLIDLVMRMERCDAGEAMRQLELSLIHISEPTRRS